VIKAASPKNIGSKGWPELKILHFKYAIRFFKAEARGFSNRFGRPLVAKYLSSLAIAMSLLSACGHLGVDQNGRMDSRNRPAWINDPGEGVSASAGFHVRGEQAQEELAITRARDEYAKRYGVVVSSEHSTSQYVVGERASSVSEKEIREEVNQIEVKASVRAKWKDPDSGMLWIWLVPAN
jgi:hypothetical protein